MLVYMKSALRTHLYTTGRYRYIHEASKLFNSCSIKQELFLTLRLKNYCRLFDLTWHLCQEDVFSSRLYSTLWYLSN